MAEPTPSARKHRTRVDVDFRERGSPLFALVAACDAFDVHLARLMVGDYLLADRVIVERKTAIDFAVSLVDGRLFPQAAALSRRPERALLLVEGRRGDQSSSETRAPVVGAPGAPRCELRPRGARWPRIHPHALKGAVVSLALMWRLPVIFARDAEDSLFVLRTAADQASRVEGELLPRYDRKPRRLTSRKLHVLQGLPGVGPVLARRLLGAFGSVGGTMTGTADALCEVKGIGPQRAAAILKVVQ
jgi:ERCC4-type nuclease